MTLARLFASTSRERFDFANDVQGFAEDEKSESYAWMFEQFMEAVEGLAPDVLFTDADPAVNTAVITTFGEGTIHLWCIWHIIHNLQIKFESKMEAIQQGRYSSTSGIVCPPLYHL